MGKIGGFKEYSRADESNIAVAERVSNYNEFTIPLKDYTEKDSITGQPLIMTDSIPPKAEHEVRPPSVTKNKFHTVKSGDTLSAIARKYHTTVAKLTSLNKLSSTTIRVGQRLKIPART